MNQSHLRRAITACHVEQPGLTPQTRHDGILLSPSSHSLPEERVLQHRSKSQSDSFHMNMIVVAWSTTSSHGNSVYILELSVSEPTSSPDLLASGGSSFSFLKIKRLIYLTL